MKAKRLLMFLFISISLSFSFLFSCNSQKEGKTGNGGHTGNTGHRGDLALFHAACFSPVIATIRSDSESDLNIRLRAEASGSQVVLRKIAELGRECDLMMIADSRLFKEIASSVCTWRLDFAHDEMVLGIGIRAKKVDEAEKDWVPVLLREDINFGRVDENLGPIGYRTLLVWKLKENERNLAEHQGHAEPQDHTEYRDLAKPNRLTKSLDFAEHHGLTEQLKARCSKVVDDVSHLAALIKAGDLEYGFLYKSTCINYDLRYIPLEKGINLGSMDRDYSGAEVIFERLEKGKKHRVKIKGAPITMSLSIPSNAVNKNSAIMFIRYILDNHAGQFKRHGFIFFKPKFYGEEKEYAMFKDYADYSGAF